jgi:hypothetical protein
VSAGGCSALVPFDGFVGGGGGAGLLNGVFGRFVGCGRYLLTVTVPDDLNRRFLFSTVLELLEEKYFGHGSA